MSRPEIEVVIYSALWYPRFEKHGSEAFLSRLKETLQAFTNAGKCVVFVADIPEFGYDASFFL